MVQCVHCTMSGLEMSWNYPYSPEACKDTVGNEP